eukprot:TRINITY_DN9234_c0_g1_i7.p2 TRINITY_DN9234_c0_g1~~TRINITY_DN9234_c0_g1_i7.p2  ORF type:complete len:150 (+),score=4.06 TRINITY_DN9234_c0_g1_i7:157-606(+)
MCIRDSPKQSCVKLSLIAFRSADLRLITLTQNNCIPFPGILALRSWVLDIVILNFTLLHQLSVSVRLFWERETVILLLGNLWALLQGLMSSLQISPVSSVEDTNLVQEEVFIPKYSLKTLRIQGAIQDPAPTLCLLPHVLCVDLSLIHI